MSTATQNTLTESMIMVNKVDPRKKKRCMFNYESCFQPTVDGNTYPIRLGVKYKILDEYISRSVESARARN